jgi:hypothetical protein
LSTTNPKGLPWAQTKASRVRSWQLTACAMAWPENDLGEEIGCENVSLQIYWVRTLPNSCRFSDDGDEHSHSMQTKNIYQMLKENNQQLLIKITTVKPH